MPPDGFPFFFLEEKEAKRILVSPQGASLFEDLRPVTMVCEVLFSSFSWKKKKQEEF